MIIEFPPMAWSDLYACLKCGPFEVAAGTAPPWCPVCGSPRWVQRSDGTEGGEAA